MLYSRKGVQWDPLNPLSGLMHQCTLCNVPCPEFPELDYGSSILCIATGSSCQSPFQLRTFQLEMLRLAPRPTASATTAAPRSYGPSVLTTVMISALPHLHF